MLDFLWGIFNGFLQLVGDFLNSAGILALVSFNPLLPVLNSLTNAWKQVSPAWTAINSFVPYHFLSDAAGILLISFTVMLVVRFLWRILKTSGD